MSPRVSIVALIYRSARLAEWVYEGLHEFTPELKDDTAEFFFVANDPTAGLLRFLKEKNYPHFVNRNPDKTEEELFKLGYAGPAYLHKSYRGWNEAVRRASGEEVVLWNSDMYPSPNWLKNLLKNFTPDRVVVAQLVERWGQFGTFMGSVHREFNGPPEFQKNEFLRLSLELQKDPRRAGRTSPGGPYIPCLIRRSVALRSGLFPEGNIAGSSFNQIADFADQVFFRRLAALGVRHVTALDSIVYHMQRGEVLE